MATANFFYKNRCVAISDNNFKSGNIPECECDYLTANKMLLKRVLMFNITINIGYYEGGCIDYSIKDDYEDILSDFYGCYYTPETKAEIINDIAGYYSEYIKVTELAKELEGLKIDKDFQQINDKLEALILPKIEDKVNEIIDDIKQKYGYPELKRVATFSNGEAIYKRIG